MGLIIGILKWLYPDGFKNGCGRDLKMVIIIGLSFACVASYGKIYVDKKHSSIQKQFIKEKKAVEEKVKIQQVAVENVFKAYHASIITQLKSINQTQRDLKKAIERTDNRVWEILKTQTN